jgi:hypothetical protein
LGGKRVISVLFAGPSVIFALSITRPLFSAARAYYVSDLPLINSTMMRKI